VSAGEEQTLSGIGARVYTAHGMAGRGDGYQCGLDWGRSSSVYKRYGYTVQIAEISSVFSLIRMR